MNLSSDITQIIFWTVCPLSTSSIGSDSHYLFVALLALVVSIGAILAFKVILHHWSIFRLYLLFPLMSSMFEQKNICAMGLQILSNLNPSIFTISRCAKVHIVNIYGIFRTKKVESFWHSRNILQGSKNDIKSKKSTNGDYSMPALCAIECCLSV